MDSLIFKKLFLIFSLLYPRKNGLRRKSNVCPLRISHSKVFSSDMTPLTLNSFCVTGENKRSRMSLNII